MVPGHGVLDRSECAALPCEQLRVRVVVARSVQWALGFQEFGYGCMVKLVREPCMISAW